jgi:hypothetical protein
VSEHQQVSEVAVCDTCERIVGESAQIALWIGMDRDWSSLFLGVDY